MITVGSVSREDAAKKFEFLAVNFRGRRTAIRELTHASPEFVFWIYPDGHLHDAKDSHLANLPRGYEDIIDDEPDYGGFLRGRVVRNGEQQLIVIYCREDALAKPAASLNQLLAGLSQIPIPLDDSALMISDNGDLYGTLEDLWNRSHSRETNQR